MLQLLKLHFSQASTEELEELRLDLSAPERRECEGRGASRKG